MQSIEEESGRDLLIENTLVYGWEAQVTKTDILHVMHFDKFNEPFIEYCKSNFDLSNHFFIIFGEISPLYKINDRDNVVITRNSFTTLATALKLLSRLCLNAKRIFFHGLFNSEVIKFFAENSNYLAKSAWILWGGDLYAPLMPSNRKRWDNLLVHRQRVISEVACIVSGIEGEYKLAVANFGAKGHFHKSLVYPSNLWIPVGSQKVLDDKCNILLGNSAAPENNHIEILSKLNELKCENMKIYCPLSYGNMEYANSVKAWGREYFGDDFIPLDSFLSKAEYDEILVNIDIAVFNHHRQQAVSNIISLLGLGKKVFLRPTVTTYEYFLNQGIKVFDVNSLELEAEFPESLVNISKVKQNYSDQKLTQDLTVLFDLDVSLFNVQS